MVRMLLKELVKCHYITYKFLLAILESHIYAGWSPKKDNSVEQTGDREGQDRLLKV